MELVIKTSHSNYKVTIEKGSLSKANQYMDLNRKVLIVHDSNIPFEYIEEVRKQCKEGYVFMIPAGEINKNLINYQAIIAYLINKNFTRKDCVVALGGGVVGDLAGFVASSYMRGIDFYNIPTTVLSMVDSSIGGKTGVDFLHVKNIVGAFYPPKAVLIDVNTLKTLNDENIASGLAEAIKMACTHNRKLFDLIKNSENLEEDIEEIIYESLMIKKSVVEQDEMESGLRQVLNFGHTIGHAIEGSYGGKLLHGHCVALGMLYFVSPAVKKELIPVLEKFNLPASIRITKTELISLMSHDKKSDENGIKVIYVDEIGSFRMETKTLKELGALL